MYKWNQMKMNSDPLLPKSYRPIALLPILSKVLEKIVFSQLVKFLEGNNLIHPNLHGHGDRQGWIVEPSVDGDCGDMVGYVDDDAYIYAQKDPTVMGPMNIPEKRSRITAGPHHISPTVSEKLFGDNLYQTLKWNDHIMDNNNSIVNQLTSRINGRKKISRNSSWWPMGCS